MPVRDVTDVQRLKAIVDALISRVERSTDQQSNAFSLFQTAINLEHQVRDRTEELQNALQRLADSNLDLRAAKDAAEEANLSKTRFLAAASHDVLQPLNAAHLSISALADVEMNKEGQELVAQVERSLTTITTLLQTLLDISKLDAKVIKPEITDVSLGQMLSSIESDFKPLAQKKGLKFRFLPTDVIVRSDRTMLRRIVQNIVSNAVRYTEKGGILVGVRKRKGKVRIEVADTGYGIPEAEHHILFDEFHRGANAMNIEGLGLGLSIVRRMADALDHRLAFTTRVDKGTVFHLDVPLSAKTALNAPKLNQPVLPHAYGLFGTKVLLIEDDPDILKMMLALLTRWECEVRPATCKNEAMKAVSSPGWAPDIIVADQHLNHGDLGSQTIMEVRKFLGVKTPALIVSGDSSSELIAVARTQGIELMRKPAKPAHLRALMAHLLA